MFFIIIIGFVSLLYLSYGVLLQDITLIEGVSSKSRLNDEKIRILDQNINDGVDIRTYRVSFEKISIFFPEYEIGWTIEKGMEVMFEKFKEIDLHANDFKDPQYYRLKSMEKLYNNKLIDDRFNWL